MDSDPAVMRYIHSGPLPYQKALVYARSEIEAAQYRRHWGKWVIAVRESSVCAGWVELSKLSGPHRDDLQVGYELAPEHWGLGYATEAIARVLEYAFREIELARSPESHCPSRELPVIASSEEAWVPQSGPASRFRRPPLR